MAPPSSPRRHHQSRQETTPHASPKLRSSRSRLTSLTATLSPSSSPARRSAATVGSSDAPSWDPLYLCDGEIVFATLQVDASIDGGAG